MLRDLRVFQKAEEINLWLYVKINNFPRGERFTLGEGIKRNALKLLEDIIRANYEVEKTVTLGEAGVTLEILRILVRMAKKQECMNFKEYEYCAEMINDCGRLLGGWMRKEKTCKRSELDPANIFGRYYISFGDGDLAEPDTDNAVSREEREKTFEKELKDLNEKCNEMPENETGKKESCKKGIWLFDK